jgi:hypothetical protein
MARISVRELLFDPDFVDPVLLLRQVETVGLDGIARYAVQPINILASVQSNDDTLEMTPDLTRTEGNYEIITTFPLAIVTDQTAPDVVLWLGALYRVISVGRFGNFATNAGHYEGIMRLTSVPVPLWLARWDKGIASWDNIAVPVPSKWDDALTLWDTTTEAWDDLHSLWDGSR